MSWLSNLFNRKYSYRQKHVVMSIGKSLSYGEIEKNLKRNTKWPKSRPVKFLLEGFAVLFNDGRIEYWKYDPTVLNKKQHKMLGINKFTAFKVEIK